MSGKLQIWLILSLVCQQVVIAGTVQMGWLKTFSNPIFATSICTPIPDDDNHGKLVDINSWPTEKPLPVRFLIGDGSIRRAVLLIDQTPGSALDRALTTALAELKDNNVNVVIRDRLAEIFHVTWSLGTDQEGDNPWDPPAPVPTALEKEQGDRLGELIVGGTAEKSDRILPIVALERFLEQPASAYCIEKALLSRLLLERLKIPSRYTAGAKLIFYKGEKIPRNLGHSWVTLEDGTILDPTEHALGKHGAVHPLAAEWFAFHGVYRFENKYYPMLVLE